MISVEAALEALLALVTPLDVEQIPLRFAAGRVLAQDVKATRTQPPFAASSMDGYALKRDEVEALGGAAAHRVLISDDAGHV